ncbi:MAG: hypothetical protein HOO93_01245 [Methyloglobulus sp.]|nr:hypothetical protein [Methyloglobulus sp.]
MEDLTGLQLMERSAQLEVGAAQLLGQMQFEFARLDICVGLCAVWVDDGKNLNELTPKVEAMSFHKKLEFVEDAVERRVRNPSPTYAGYQAWFARAHAARLQRNELVHGRWGIDPMTNQVLNILGLPTSDGQRERRYSLAELETVLAELKDLQYERTSTGLALGPRTGQGHHPSRGPSTKPVVSAQLKRYAT